MVVLQLHFLYLSNGNFVSQKEQTKLGVVTAAGVGFGVDSVASSSVDPPSFLVWSGGELFIASVSLYVFTDLFTFLFLSIFF